MHYKDPSEKYNIDLKKMNTFPQSPYNSMFVNFKKKNGKNQLFFKDAY